MRGEVLGSKPKKDFVPFNGNLPTARCSKFVRHTITFVLLIKKKLLVNFINLCLALFNCLCLFYPSPSAPPPPILWIKLTSTAGMTIWQRLSYTPPSSEHIYYLQLNGESNFINSHDCRDNKLIQMLKYWQIMCFSKFYVLFKGWGSLLY